jgi:hypothetical protein
MKASRKILDFREPVRRLVPLIGVNSRNVIGPNRRSEGRIIPVSGWENCDFAILAISSISQPVAKAGPALRNASHERRCRPGLSGLLSARFEALGLGGRAMNRSGRRVRGPGLPPVGPVPAPGGSWRVSTMSRPRIGVVNQRRCAGAAAFGVRRACSRFSHVPKRRKAGRTPNASAEEAVYERAVAPLQRRSDIERWKFLNVQRPTSNARTRLSALRSLGRPGRTRKTRGRFGTDS